MKLYSDLNFNGKLYKKGDEVPARPVYTFFVIHMLAFGVSGFVMAYAKNGPDMAFMYLFGGLAIFAYLMAYLTIFGPDEVKWMLINAGLGILGIYSQIDWLLFLFGKQVSDFPFTVHIIPFLYFILYTFLLRQAVLDLTNARDDEDRKRKVEFAYVGISMAVYLSSMVF